MTIIDAFKGGDIVRFIGFGNSDLNYRRKLLALGLTPGTEILISRIAPLGCPIQLKIRGIALALRKNEAAHLNWERI